MNTAKWLATSLCILTLAACGGKSAVPIPQVIEQPPKYCPAPVRPVLAEPATTPVLLDDYLTVVEYALQLEATVRCYEETKTTIKENGK